MENKEIISALELFNEKAEKLRSRSFTRSLNGSGVTMSFKKGEADKIERRGPNIESIDAFVLTFRFFIQNNEKISLGNVADIYDNLPSQLQEEKNLFLENRQEINSYLDSISMFNFNNKRFTKREILDVFIYGGLAHANEDQKKIFDTWMKIPPLVDIIENEFICIMADMMSAILCIRNLNNEVIKKLKFN